MGFFGRVFQQLGRETATGQESAKYDGRHRRSPWPFFFCVHPKRVSEALERGRARRFGNEEGPLHLLLTSLICPSHWLSQLSI